MKILHTISSMGVKSGGTSSCLYDLVCGAEKYQAEVLTFALDDDDKLSGDAIKVDFVKQPKDKRFLYSSNYKRSLKGIDSDIYHTHGLWQYTEYVTAKVARKNKIPYIITPHGMLYPQALAHSKFMKKQFLRLFLKKDLDKASCIHVTCEEEMQHIRNLGVTSPIAIIPNGVVLKDKVATEYVKGRIGYLGRLHSRKRVERLLHAFAKQNNDSLELLIIGDGDAEYLSFLKAEITRLKLANICFTGFLSGKEKDEAIASLDFLVVPSDFENFGMIVLDALMNEVPVIASRGTPWSDLEKYNCGFWVDNDIETLTRCIAKALDLDDGTKIEMGRNGRSLVEKKYSTVAVCSQMEQLYDWVLKKRELPDFVYLKD